MKPIKILQLCAVDFTVKNLLLPLIDKLTDEGFDVHIMCSDGKDIQDLKRKGYTVKTVKIIRKISPVANLSSLIKIYKYIKNEEFDIVHVHTPVAGILGRIAAKIAGAPLIIYTAHGFYFHDGMSKWKKNTFINIEKFVGRFFTDLIFTQSMEDKEAAIRHGIIAEDRIYHIGNGVDVKKYSVDNVNINYDVKKKELNLSLNANIISFIGRIVKEKGIIDLIKAFRIIIDELSQVNLLIIGDNSFNERDVTTKKEVLSLINELDIKDKIIFAGYRKDINELLAISDVFVLPSYREGMPRSIIEAMSMGKPVVATNIRGCREEIEDGKTGFLVPVNSPEKLAEAIIKILKNRDLAIDMGRKGRIRALNEFNEKLVLEKQVKIMKQWLN